MRYAWDALYRRMVPVPSDDEGTVIAGTSLALTWGTPQEKADYQAKQRDEADMALLAVATAGMV